MKFQMFSCSPFCGKKSDSDDTIHKPPNRHCTSQQSQSPPVKKESVEKFLASVAIGDERFLQYLQDGEKLISKDEATARIKSDKDKYVDDILNHRVITKKRLMKRVIKQLQREIREKKRNEKKLKKKLKKKRAL